MSSLSSSRQIQETPKELDFAPTERPSWRDGPDWPETSTMLSQIETWTQTLSQLSNTETPFVLIFNRRESVEFVLLSNQMEREGTQDAGSTEQLVLSAMGHTQPNPQLKMDEKATVQTYHALNQLYHKRIEMLEEAQENGKSQETLFMTTDLILDCHKVLMNGLINDAGKYREVEAYPAGYDSFYVAPQFIEAQLESLLDNYNSIIANVKDLNNATIFKLAAWFLYHFLTIHPFSDGNGRLARILVNSILFLHVPFPVALRPRSSMTATGARDSVDQWRQHYINSIVACREDVQVERSKHRPRDLAALIIQSVWHSWKSFTAAFELRRDSVALGPLVVLPTDIRSSLALKVSKWSKSCDAEAAADAILQSLADESNIEFTVQLSDKKTIKVIDRRKLNDSPASIPTGATIIELRLKKELV